MSPMTKLTRLSLRLRQRKELKETKIMTAGWKNVGEMDSYYYQSENIKKEIVDAGNRSWKSLH